MSENKVKERINEIIEKEFNGYGGEKLKDIKKVHERLRSEIVDDDFIKYLEWAIKQNPKPSYKITQL